MEEKKESKKLDLYELLSKPIPKEVLFSYEEDGKTFTGYKAQYAIDLLNKVVGLGNWRTEENIRKEETLKKGFIVAMDLVLTILRDDKTNPIIITGHSAAYARRVENAYKAAKTSAFKQACRYLGIGRELYYQQIEDDIVTEKNEEEEIEEVTLEKEGQALLDKINKAINGEQLKSLEEIIKKVEGKATQDVLIKKYNDKMISLNEKK